MELATSHIAVTGGGSGLGEATARALAAPAAHLGSAAGGHFLGQLREQAAQALAVRHVLVGAVVVNEEEAGGDGAANLHLAHLDGRHPALQLRKVEKSGQGWLRMQEQVTRRPGGRRATA